jgi:hypothetical protein
MRSESVEEMVLCNQYEISNNTVERIASSFPNLRALRINKVDVASVILHLPKLESLYCINPENFSGSFDHQNLKHISIKSDICYEANENIIAVVERCVNAISLKLDTKLPKEFVEKLLRSSPKLKALSLYGLAQDYVQVLKEYGGSLELFCCYNYFESHPDLEWLKNELKDIFDEIAIEKNSFIAKKKGIGEKFGSFH